MMTNEQIMNEIQECATLPCELRAQGRDDQGVHRGHYRDDTPDHIKGYKFADGESHGIRRFNIDQINHLELVS